MAKIKKTAAAPRRRTAATPRRTTSYARFTVMVGRLGSDPEKLQASSSTTVGQLLEKSGTHLGGSERVLLNGEGVSLETKLKKGDWVSIVSPKEAGL